MTTSEKMTDAYQQVLENRILYATGYEVDRQSMNALDNAFTDYKKEKALLEKTQAHHDHGGVAPSCVGCPTAEAEAEIEKLKPCPFCGNTVIVEMFANTEDAVAFCGQCGCEFNAYLWNTRYESEKEHPADKLSREATMTNKIEKGKPMLMSAEECADSLQKRVVNIYRGNLNPYLWKLNT